MYYFTNDARKHCIIYLNRKALQTTSRIQIIATIVDYS